MQLTTIWIRRHLRSFEPPPGHHQKGSLLRSEWLLRSMKSFGWAPVPRFCRLQSITNVPRQLDWHLPSKDSSCIVASTDRSRPERSEIFFGKSPRTAVGSLRVSDHIPEASAF